MKKDTTIYLGLVVIVLFIIAGIFLCKQSPRVTPRDETIKCIAEKSELYIQLRCHYCQIQEEMFGESSIYLNIIDCHDFPEKCEQAQITGTPTWIINGEKYPGVQQIETLKELTGC